MRTVDIVSLVSLKNIDGVVGVCPQVHYMQTGGRSKLLAREDARPSMQDLRCALLTLSASA